MSIQTASNLINTSLPLWDNIEALFFVFGGLSGGVVIGFLFPSLWRSFRRKFRNESKYNVHNEKWENISNLNLKILSEKDLQQKNNEPETNLYLSFIQAFTAARYFFQMGEPRKSIQFYIEILVSENVSKQHTNQALFELSQVYAQIGLNGRAFDTGYEILNRKPHQNQVMSYLLKLCSENLFIEKVNLILKIYKGSFDSHSRKMISHIFSRASELFFEKQNLDQAITYARMSVRWDRTSGRALVKLWETTSYQFWNKNNQNDKLKWLSFATDLEAISQILAKSKISPVACSAYLSKLIENILTLQNNIVLYKSVENEFKVTFNWEKLPLSLQKLLLSSIFTAFILLQKKEFLRMLSKESNFIEILSIMTNNQHQEILECLNYPQKNEKLLFLGILAHQCSQCQTFHSEFAWQCSHCQFEESLFPVNNNILMENLN